MNWIPVIFRDRRTFLLVLAVLASVSLVAGVLAAVLPPSRDSWLRQKSRECAVQQIVSNDNTTAIVCKDGRSFVR